MKRRIRVASNFTLPVGFEGKEDWEVLDAIRKAVIAAVGDCAGGRSPHNHALPCHGGEAHRLNDIADAFCINHQISIEEVSG